MTRRAREHRIAFALVSVMVGSLPVRGARADERTGSGEATIRRRAEAIPEEPPPEPRRRDDRISVAQDLLASARARRADGDDAGALALLEASEVLDPTFDVLVEEGRAHQRLGHVGRARELYAIAGQRADSDEERELVETHLLGLEEATDAPPDDDEAPAPDESDSPVAVDAPTVPPWKIPGPRAAPPTEPQRRPPPPITTWGPGPPGVLRPEARARRAIPEPKIDGVLDDEAWRLISEVDSFVTRLPRGGQPPAEATSFRIGYTPDAVIIAFDCASVKTPIDGRITRRDGVDDVDWISVAFDAGRTRRRAFEFKVSAAGVQADTLYYDDDFATSDWDEVWASAVHTRKDGWSAEIRIPFRALRTQAGEPILGFQARRQMAKRREVIEWAPMPRELFGEVSRYGDLSGFQEIKGSNGIDIRPYVLGRLRHQDARPDFSRSGWSAEPSIGADLRWNMTRHLKLTAAVKPDFGQLDADAAVLNLTNYEVQLPERRPFFLEGLDLFRTPLETVFTRRVGAVPPAATLTAPGEENLLLANPLGPAAIYGAAKLAGTVGKVTSLGAFVAMTAPVTGLLEGSDGAQVLRTATPMALYAALRPRFRVGEGVQVGLLGTAVARFEGVDDPLRFLSQDQHGLPAPAYPTTGGSVVCPSGALVAPGERCFHDAYVGGADVRWHVGGGDYIVTAQAIASVRQHGPPQPLADGTILTDGASGFGTFADLTKSGGEHWVGAVTHRFASNKLDYNDLGFMYRQNEQLGTARLEYRTLQPWGYTRETHTAVRLREHTNLDGLDQGHQIGVDTAWTFLSMWTVTLANSVYLARFDDRELGNGVALERAVNDETVLGMSSNPSSRFYVRASGAVAFRPNGASANVEGAFVYRPVPAVELQLAPQLFETRGEPRFAGRDASAVALFGPQNAYSASVTLRANIFFHPRLSLQLYGQLFSARVEYDTLLVSGQENIGAGGRSIVKLSTLVPYEGAATIEPSFSTNLNTNAVLTWEYRPGSRFILAYSHGRVPPIATDPSGPPASGLRTLFQGPATDTILAKLDYYFD